MDKNTELMLQKLIDQVQSGQLQSPVEQVMSQYKRAVDAAWDATGHTHFDFYVQLKSLLQHKLLETLYRM